MSYTAAIQQLSAMVPELYTRPGQARRKFSLDEIRVLLGALGDPHRRFRSVLIAGTNGKGSTAFTLASILAKAGIRTGLYTSPHLEQVNERIRVGGVLIEDEDFARQYFVVQEAAGRLVENGRLEQFPSFFETITAMAFLHFAERGVEIAVLEVGMGGRLDATNVVDPVLSVITDISLDHTEWLGSTIAEIAREKAGILREGGTLIVLPQHPEANRVIGEAVEKLGVRAVSAAQFVPARGDHGEEFRVSVLGQEIGLSYSLVGDHQKRNMALAVAAAEELAWNQGVALDARDIALGVRRLVWPGRLEQFVEHHGDREEIKWVLDVAHNPAGAWALRAALSAADNSAAARTLVFSCLRDKPVAEMAQILFPLFDEVIFAPIQSPRATPTEELLAAARATGTPGAVVDSVAEAIERAAQLSPFGTVVVTGSVYLVGEARPLIRARIGARG
jgi:dihydrofolate synthase/folylpolyglutamate synthase